MSWFDSFTPNDMTAMQEGMNFLSAGTNYMADKAQAKSRQQWQDYKNSMVNISNALNQNAFSVNETEAVRTAVDTDAAIQRGGILYGAKQETMAAAAGVQGKSVNQGLIDIQNHAAQRESNNQIELQSQLNNFAEQRQKSQMSALEEQNYSFIPKPQAGTYLMGAMMQNAKLDMNSPQDTSGGNMYSPQDLFNQF